LADAFNYGVQRAEGGLEFLLVVGRIDDLSGDDEPAVHFDGGLGVVGLLEVLPAARFHDAAFGIGEVELVAVSGACLRRLGGFAAWLASALALLLAALLELL
jgi:hypothetical protein